MTPPAPVLPSSERPSNPHGLPNPVAPATVDSGGVYGWPKLVGLFLGPALFLTLLFLPLPSLEAPMQRLVAVLALVIVYWMTEAIPLAATALLGPALCILLGVASDRVVLAPFGSPVIFKYIGMFFLTAAMQKHGLDRRLALTVLTLPGVSRSPWRVFVGLALLTAALGMWMNPLSTTAVMLPIALGVIRTSPAIASCAQTRQALVLLIAFSASVGGISTPVGTAPNIITVAHLQQLTGERVSTLRWMLLAAPLVIALMIYLVTQLRPRIAGSAADNLALARDFADQRTALGKLKLAEAATAIALGGAILLWLAPGIGELVGYRAGIFGKGNVSDEMVGLCAGLALFMVPTDLRRGEFVLSWRDGAKIDWGTVMLAAGGLSLGALIFNTGLAKTMGGEIANLLQHTQLPVIIGVGIVLSVGLSEIASNTAAANVTVPLMIAVAQAAGVDPVPVALACAFACTFGFMLPVSSGPNTLAYATGEVRVRGMMRHGVALDAIGIIAIWATLHFLGTSFRVMS